MYDAGCPKKHGNSVTNLISSLLWNSIVIPNFKSHNIIMSARVYFMKRAIDCKDVSIMSLQDEQWRRSSFTKYNRVQSKHKQTTCDIADETLKITSFSVGITILNQRIILKKIYRILHWIPMFIGTPCIRPLVKSMFCILACVYQVTCWTVFRVILGFLKSERST